MGNLNNANFAYRQRRRVRDIKIHHDWNTHMLNGPDIALLELETPATLNKNVRISSLAKKGTSFLGQDCVLAGWGYNSTDQTHSPDRLQEVCHVILSMFRSTILLTKR